MDTDVRSLRGLERWERGKGKGGGGEWPVGAEASPNDEEERRSGGGGERIKVTE